jgi:hypothetical protein
MRVRAFPLLLIALVLAACAPVANQAATPTPDGTTAAACPAAPTPGAIPDWTSPASPTVLPVIVSSQQACGLNRFVFSMLDSSSRPVASPDRSARIAFYDLGRDPSTPVSQGDATFVWAIEGSVGVYVTTATFDQSGRWGAAITTSKAGGAAETIRITFDVQPKATTLGIGDRAPADKTPTLADVGGDVAQLSTDPSPDPAMYQTSIAAAIAAAKPFVVVFATPKFCTSGQCGPTLDRVKQVMASFPGVTFINVEPYELTWANGQLQAVLDANGQLKPVQAVTDWGLVSEPWIFVVDRTGTITGSFEGVVGSDELAAAIRAVE